MFKQVLGLTFLLCWYQLCFAEDSEYSSKLVLRTGMGVFMNQGSQGGGSTGVGGFNLQYYKFLNSYLAAGVGYQAQFDLNNGSVPLSGYEILGRIYLFGRGTNVHQESSWGKVMKQSLYAPYLISMYGKRQFYLGEDTESTDPSKYLSGEYGVINAGLGIDQRLNKFFELNAEFNTSLFALSSSDKRVRISETFFWMGLNYVF